ncbi:nucleotidyltransferase domain-containing protein [Kitasatospora camelliae]|uniref:Nucleotidyltransferase domain-containing protein n=1 Tax=Kitasatospora camelliae TaxID=3156397 RepID=A0AAU8JR18_9ACTN
MTSSVSVTDGATRLLLERFIGDLRPLPSLVAVWAHGSLAGGDYRAGPSDLDLVAVLDRPCSPAEEAWLNALHARLDAEVPSAARLHCSYLAAGELDDPDLRHLTWAHRELMRRPVTPVTRRELHAFGRVLSGPAPAGLLPPVTDRELAEFVAGDLRDYWRPALADPLRWRRDIWVDLGRLTLARATVTLRTGRLITKAEAVDVLAELGAPAELVADVRRRRYGRPAPVSEGWDTQRAELTRDFLGPAIDRALAAAAGR